MKGYIHIYTGNGKGKTTAALGLALRASGAGLKVFIGQFVKGMVYNEIKSIEHCLKQVVCKQYGQDCFIVNKPVKKDKRMAREGLQEMESVIEKGEFDVVIMDEVFIALYYHLFENSDLIRVIGKKPDHMELVLTGRYAPRELIDLADLVTEMKEVKHYYMKGVQAREGIEH